MHRRHWFQYVANGILVLFLGILAFVCMTAYMRHSGTTGLDMATIQKMRYEALPQKSPSSPHVAP